VLTYKELERLVCGRKKVDLEMLKGTPNTLFCRKIALELNGL